MRLFETILNNVRCQRVEKSFVVFKKSKLFFLVWHFKKALGTTGKLSRCTTLCRKPFFMEFFLSFLISQWFWFRWQNCVALNLNSVKRYWHFNSLEIHSIELQEQFQYRLCSKTELIRQCQFLRFSIITWRVHVFNQIQIIFYGFTHLIRPNQSWTELRCGTLLIVVV